MNLKIEICKLQTKESHARRKWVVAHPSRRYAPPPIPPCPLPSNLRFDGADEPRLRYPKKSARHCRDYA